MSTGTSSHPDSGARYDTIVVGAGFAGLTAARELSAAGQHVLLIEANDRIGGRTFYAEYPAVGRAVEYGGTWFSTEDMKSLAAEIQRYGIAVSEQPEPEKFVWNTGRTARAHAPIPGSEIGAAEMFLAELRRGMDSMPNGHLVPGADYTEFDVPVSQWAPVQELPDASREFVYAWAAMYGGCSPDEVSVAHYVRMFAEFGNRATALYDGLAQKFTHGTKSLAEALLADFTGDFVLSSPVTDIVQESGGVRVETVLGHCLASDVVCAAPLNTLSRITFDPPLDAEKTAAIETGHPCRSIKVWIRATGVPSGLFGVGWGGPFQWVSNEYSLDDGSDLIVGFGYDPSACDVGDLQAIQAALRHFAPEAVVVSASTHDWEVDPYALGAWSVWGPGWLGGGHANAFAHPHGRVRFASSDHAIQWPGWIDGAIHSGMEQAQALLSPTNHPDNATSI